MQSRRLVRLVATLFASIVSALAFGPHAHALTLKIPTMFVFGDSIADIGNDLILTRKLGYAPAIPPSASPQLTYYQGRFSNGPVAVEYLWELISRNAPGSKKALKPALSITNLGAGQSLNFAFGGAGTGISTRTPTGFVVPGLLGQVGMFRAFNPSGSVAKPPLYVIVAGSNDYLFATPSAPAQPATVVGNIAKAIQQLYALGARNFLVLNLPDLGTLPLLALLPNLTLEERQALSALLSGQSAAHNELLAQTLGALPGQLPGARVIPVNLGAAAANLPPGINLETPALETFGFAQGISTCLFTVPAICPEVSTFDVSPTYFYWDAEHPTTTVHRLLGRAMYEALP
jgi:phospholipase/lecithinase/hemolysin